MNSTPVTPLTGTADVECKCCGAAAYQRVGTRVQGGEQRSWTCSLCSDGWVATLRHNPETGGTLGRWVHIPQWSPILTRTIKLDFNPDNFMLDTEDEDWDYRLAGEEVSMEKWFNMLEIRRKNLRNRLAQ